MILSGTVSVEPVFTLNANEEFLVKLPFFLHLKPEITAKRSFSHVHIR